MLKPQEAIMNAINHAAHHGKYTCTANPFYLVERLRATGATVTQLIDRIKAFDIDTPSST